MIVNELSEQVYCLQALRFRYNILDSPAFRSVEGAKGVTKRLELAGTDLNPHRAVVEEFGLREQVHIEQNVADVVVADRYSSFVF